MRKLAISFVTLTSLTACSQGDELASQWSFDLPDNTENDEQFARFGEPLASPGYDRLASADPMIEDETMPSFAPPSAGLGSRDVGAVGEGRDFDAELEVEFNAVEDILAEGATSGSSSISDPVQSSADTSSDLSLEELVEFNFPRRGPRPDPLAYVQTSPPALTSNRVVTANPINRTPVSYDTAGQTPTAIQPTMSQTPPAVAAQSNVPHLSPMPVPTVPSDFTIDHPEAVRLSLQSHVGGPEVQSPNSISIAPTPTPGESTQGPQFSNAPVSQPAFSEVESEHDAAQDLSLQSLDSNTGSVPLETGNESLQPEMIDIAPSNHHDLDQDRAEVTPDLNTGLEADLLPSSTPSPMMEEVTLENEALDGVLETEIGGAEFQGAEYEELMMLLPDEDIGGTKSTLMNSEQASRFVAEPEASFNLNWFESEEAGVIKAMLMSRKPAHKQRSKSDTCLSASKFNCLSF